MRTFAERLIAWHRMHGRHELPWQQNPIPYRVWVSEVMLQQTQAATVIPYFELFIERFPDVRALAKAPLDEVLSLWSGLGYYTRARNLHAAAISILEKHDGDVPTDFETLVALPGIGRSTAGAVLALSLDLPYPILDGNAKRVFMRFHAVSGWPGRTTVLKELWRIAEKHVPNTNARAYTQALMDLGATVCTPKAPDCTRCPLESDCDAYRIGNPELFPEKRPRREVPERPVTMLIVSDPSGAVLLEQRPATGVWGGLWSFPELGAGETAETWCVRHGLYGSAACKELPVLMHRLTHRRLMIRPVRVRVDSDRSRVQDGDTLRWYETDDLQRVGLATPVSKLIDQISLDE